jgi:hypothetical protein
MRIHEAGDRAYGRWRRRKHAPLREQLAGADNRRHAGGADDRNAGFEERAPTCVGAQCLIAVGAADVDCAGDARPAATVGEFPPRKVGAAHGSDSCIVERHCEESHFSVRRAADGHLLGGLARAEIAVRRTAPHRTNTVLRQITSFARRCGALAAAFRLTRP